jgi:glycosyltransferase involved in cell wall biosynthesis
VFKKKDSREDTVGFLPVTAMKILFLIDSLGSAGKERQLIELLKGLKTQKNVRFQVVVLSASPSYDSYVKDLGEKNYFLERKVKKDLSIFLKLYKICKQFQPDVIHSWESMCSVYVTPIAKILGIQFINGLIRNVPPNLRPFGKRWIREKLTFPFSDIILANSYAGLRSFKVSKRKGYCIHNGFDFLRIENLQERESIRRKFNISTPNVVGMVGTFNIRKDYKTFLLSAMHILQKRKDVTFVAVGDGSNAREDEGRSTFEKCQAMVKAEFEERIKFFGKQKDVESIVNIFDVGVLLTNRNVHGEGISNSIMEYMALAKPVIATDGGGTGEIVVNDKTGFLLGSSNVEAIAERIEFLLDNKEIATAMGNAGKERLFREFSLEKMTDRYIELYRKCMG